MNHIDNFLGCQIPRLEDISFEDDLIPGYITDIRTSLSANIETSIELDINPYLYGKMMHVDLAQCRDMTSFTVEGSLPYQVQIRRHKKKRINKKWAKRYGYKTKFRKIELKDVSIRECDDDIDILGRCWNGLS